MDGDTDSSDVQSEFTRVLLEEMEKAEAIAAIPRPQTEQDSHQNNRGEVFIRQLHLSYLTETSPDDKTLRFNIFTWKWKHYYYHT